MRFVTWNMGRSRRTHDAAWHYLLKYLKPDVACVQEALGSAEGAVTAFGSITWSNPRPGGTGVFVRRGLEFTQVPSSVRGSYVAAVSVATPKGNLPVFSVHVGPESWRNQTALEPWLVSQARSGPCVVGGDFNTSRLYSARHKAYLDALVRSGVHDCCCEGGREAQSFWGHQSRGAKYQDDHFFASPLLADAVARCCVDDSPLTRILSDHGPVVLDLRESAGYKRLQPGG